MNFTLKLVSKYSEMVMIFSLKLISFFVFMIRILLTTSQKSPLGFRAYYLFSFWTKVFNFDVHYFDCTYKGMSLFISPLMSILRVCIISKNLYIMWGRRPKTWGTEMWIPEDPFSRTEERLRKTRQRVSLSYFYSLKICFKFIRFCTLCLLACRTISEQFIFFFIFKVLSIHFQNSFILIFCHRPIILYFINFYKNSLS